ncbi:MAG: tetratricopeptide repeat protein [Clostridiales bacterium]|jgi:tetratricopeptide (TPR) repeat protein|nr:tetratricopeptide repeat protein [Clostridiales bacterium]
MMHIDCPRCGNIAANNLCGRRCDKCGLDIALHKMAHDMSARYYNIGLLRAREGNLSAAKKALGISLQINKKNRDARNLLGLCFYNTGRIGEALREWAISARFSPGDNLAQDYLDALDGNIPLLEKYSESMIKYNEALIYAERYSEDLAKIRLRRAVEAVPNFVDAMNLLALHYLNEGDKTRAAALVERVLAIDSGNALAKKYYFEIFQKHPGATIRREAASRNEAPKTRAPGRPEPKQSPNPFAARTKKAIPKVSPLSGIISALLGMAAMFLFMHLLIFPGRLAERDDALEALQQHMDNAHRILQESISERDDTIDRLNSELTEATAQSHAQSDTITNFMNQLQVYNALNYLNDNEPSQALSLLDEVNTANLPDAALEVYNNIRHTATPLVEQIYYTQGQALFNAGNYTEARIALEAAALHATPGSAITDDILYFLGRIAEIDGDIQLAILYYQSIIDNHAQSNRRWPAQNRLNAIQ